MADLFRIGNNLLRINGNIAAGFIPVTSESLVTTFQDSQISSGNWDLIDEMFHFGMQTEEAGLIGMKGISSAEVVNAPTWTAGLGYPSFNGSTQYIKTNWIPDTHGVNYTFEDALFGAFILNDTDAFQGIPLGAAETSGLSGTSSIHSRKLLNGNYYYINNATFLVEGSQAIADNTLVLIGRDGSVNTWSDNGIEQAENFQSPVAIPEVDFYIGCEHRDAATNQFWQGGISSCVFGAKVGFDEVNFYDNLAILNAGLAAL